MLPRIGHTCVRHHTISDCVVSGHEACTAIVLSLVNSRLSLSLGAVLYLLWKSLLLLRKMRIAIDGRKLCRVSCQTIIDDDTRRSVELFTRVDNLRKLFLF